MKTDIQSDSIANLEFAKPCETTIRKCDLQATHAVWCDHHGQGCDYSGFRCDVHTQFLREEIQDQVDAANAGFYVQCLSCGARMGGGLLSEHFRCVKL